MSKLHSFHIPVMGIGFTIDTPLKVAHLGIDSVVSITDDGLLEKLRKKYCEQYQVQYKEISDKVEDFRAKRITSYLNLVQDLAEKKFDTFKKSALEKKQVLQEYLQLLPDGASLLKELQQPLSVQELTRKVEKAFSLGSFDVNIMTKLDKENFSDGEKLPIEFNDAHAAVRGYAMSNLSSSVVFSAGMNPRLYTYLEQFEDFYPDGSGFIKKKIVLKVSDYRSALVQGKILAKKGLWVSEYRIESGLNCGGHAFATDGYLMGPILAEFRDKRTDLIEETFELYQKALTEKERTVLNSTPEVKITAQGGVGTAEEHEFLLDHYQIDSVGWGSPFLLVPEATTVDTHTLHQLEEAKENDLYLSNVSPLGVLFNNLKGNLKDVERDQKIAKGRPGSNCPKKILALNTEVSQEPLCTASKQYQHAKIKALQKQDLSKDEYQNAYNKIVEKSCICVGLGTSALLENDIETKAEGKGVSVCPGPNMAYFSKSVSLKQMVDHIYGKTNIIERTDRPHMFMKELNMYVDYLKNKLDELDLANPKKQKRQLEKFATNLNQGIDYYFDLINGSKNLFRKIEPELQQYRNKVLHLTSTIQSL